MTCTGGDDWAPYSSTLDRHSSLPGLNSSHTFSKGIVRSVYLAVSSENTAIIEQVTPFVHYLGEYPTKPLRSETAGPWRVEVSIQLLTSSTSKGTLKIQGNWSEAATVELAVNAGAAGRRELRVNLTAEHPDLWWPNSYGGQSMYTVTATFSPSDTGQSQVVAGTDVVQATARMGFRYSVLVTGNDTDVNFREAAATGDGSGGHTMMIRVNGAPVLGQGSNVIPFDELEGRLSALNTRRLVQSMQAAHYTMVRIWGGGIVQSREFYDALDEAGILCNQDMMFTGSHSPPPVGSEPSVFAIFEAEIRGVISQLARHPSIVLWNGCNECGGGAGQITDFVLPIVAMADPTRPIWPAAPAHNAWKSGVNTLTGYPNGKKLTLGGPPVNETHGPYQVRFEVHFPSCSLQFWAELGLC